MTAAFKPLIERAIERSLGRDEAETAFRLMMEGAATPPQIAGFLIALRTRGETVGEIVAAATVMREKAKPVRAPADAIDVVGTGGDAKGTLNISTAAAVVVAGAGVPVAKHGNKALSSQSGAADALAGLGVQVMVPPATAQKAMDACRLCFMMAPMHHPATRHVQPVRQELGTRTVFNILGPLTNPASVTRQLTGAYSRRLLRPMAETLKALGTRAAWLVHGEDGTDELSIAGPSWVVALAGNDIREFKVTPEDAGLPRHPFKSILGGTPEHNTARFRALLEGEDGSYRDAVLLNAAAALVIAGAAPTLRKGVQQAAASLDEGKALAKLEALAKATAAPAESGHK